MTSPLLIHIGLHKTGTTWLQQGIFADPAYGGNRDKAGWKMVGFPGVAAAYVGLIEQYNQPYNRMPVSLGDMQQRLVQIDHHGHPIHPLIEDIAKK